MSRYTVLFQVKTSLNRVTPDIFFANVDTFLGKFMSFDNSFATAFFPKWTRKWSFCTLGILGQPWFGYSKLWNVKHISVRRNFIYPLYISSNTWCLENIHISIFQLFNLNRYFLREKITFEYLLLRPNFKIHADRFRIKNQSIETIFKS